MENFLLILLLVFQIVNSQAVSIPKSFSRNSFATNDLLNTLQELKGKIGWEDHNLLDKEESREGPGEHGSGVLFNVTERNMTDELIQVHGFNSLASDKISLYRTINDLRITKCKWLKYDDILPPASIIIPFHNEHWSTLLRTIHSLLSRSPAKLIKEVILVDDNSTKTFLGHQLDQYVSEHFTNVRILRTEKLEGLIRTRLLGAKAASGTVLIFMDSHCEVGINWLPPLLQPIRNNYKTVTCPFIDVIRHDDFSLHSQDEGARGAFDWNLNYKRLPRLPEDEAHPEQPFDSPIMAGRVFAISRSWFWELGGYDDGLEMWGGEQFELSFKIWMCGGRMIDVPCSRIGHVFKTLHSLDFVRTNQTITRNYKRIAEVWMDHWKKFVYERRLKEYSSSECGDINMQKDLRQKLNCKSFDWFMKNVAFDILYLYSPVEIVEIYNCTITSESDSSLCIDSKFGKQGNHVKIDKCILKEKLDKSKEQKFSFTADLEIRPGERNICFDYENNEDIVLLSLCNRKNGNQRWKYNANTNQIINTNSQKCIKLNSETMELFVVKCSSNILQKWILKNLNRHRK